MITNSVSQLLRNMKLPAKFGNGVDGVVISVGVGVELLDNGGDVTEYGGIHQGTEKQDEHAENLLLLGIGGDVAKSDRCE